MSQKMDLPETVSNRTRPAPYRLLDAWRGVASFGVFAYHWGLTVVHYTPALAENVVYRISQYGFLGVQIFFVISGFCIVASAIGLIRKFESQFASKGIRPSVGRLLGSYATARARRVYPTYWAGLGLSILFSWTATQMARAGRIPENDYTHFDAAHLSPLTLFANISLLAVPLHQVSLHWVAWTLCYEVAFYAIIGFVMGIALLVSSTRKVESDSGGTLLNFLHCITLGSLIWLCFKPNAVPFPLELWPQFGLGVLLYDVLMVRKPERKRIAALALIGAFCLIVVFLLLQNARVGWMGQPSRLTFLTSGAFTLLLLLMYRHDSFLMNKIWVRGMGFIGLFSYSLYLTHTLTIRVVGQLLLRAHLLPRFHLLAFVFATAVSLVVGYLFFLLFEKPLLSRRKIHSEPVP